MPGYRSGEGDPAHTLALLWREPGFGRSSRGPKQGLTVDRIVDLAVELADQVGLDGVSMRSVAKALGVAPMSLYTYVPGKAELLDLMVDTVYLRMPRPALDQKVWRARLTAIAQQNRALFKAHPWLVEVSTARPPLGPGLMAKYEYELRAFAGLNLDDVTTDDALAYLLTFVQAASRAALTARASQRDTAMNDEQWWAANEPLLARVFDPEAYPTAVRIGSAAGAAHAAAYDADHAYTFGLARVLDGLAGLVPNDLSAIVASQQPPAV
ncbi:TetR/AcrR family transcriptional regulator [Micromonospora sp. KC207]|uniref:TetR/AcrR family transcriptional regulator n=1 Tax=Micromonospora sp. KC207 TaxID=2530377 RepID=UPI001043AE75|nr:TetR/AcrR family transcriptional regulator [Micromonospora sp. KC207]TDC60223.1 TetR/AcrR family transcriptional regulator [Micromonospora sp. KC207]